MQINPVLWLVLGLTLIISVITDLKHRRILDIVTVPAFAVLLLIRLAWEGLGGLETGFVSGLLAAAACGGLFALLAWRGRMGWGDVKLMAVVGAAFGYPLGLAALIFISLCGALQAVVTLLARRGRHIPYGVAIALGSVWTAWWHTATGG